MPCPTCSATLAKLAETNDGDRIFYHCERCGTVAVQDAGDPPERRPFGDVYVPKLVERCRAFEAQRLVLKDGLWVSLGIRDAIHSPEARPS